MCYSEGEEPLRRLDIVRAHLQGGSNLSDLLPSVFERDLTRLLRKSSRTTTAITLDA
jgi:hypothetical protein